MDILLSLVGSLAMIAYGIYCFLPKPGRGPSAKKALLAASSTMSVFQSDDYDRLDRDIVGHMIEKYRLTSQYDSFDLTDTILEEVTHLTEHRYYWGTQLPSGFCDVPRNKRKLDAYYQATHEATATHIMELIWQRLATDRS